MGQGQERGGRRGLRAGGTLACRRAHAGHLFAGGTAVHGCAARSPVNGARAQQQFLAGIGSPGTGKDCAFGLVLAMAVHVCPAAVRAAARGARAPRLGHTLLGRQSS